MSTEHDQNVSLCAMSPKPAQRGRGFTLVELLAVIAIIGLLLALLLPAIQGARESARRLRCANNMRQVAMALQTYAASGQAFPYGTLDDGLTTVRARDTWMQQTWPYLEQTALFQQYTAWMTCPH